MTQAKALFDAGELGRAVEELLREVNANPADTTRRTFLFEWLCFTGDWDRAEKQLDVIGHHTQAIQQQKGEGGQERDLLLPSRKGW